MEDAVLRTVSGDTPEAAEMMALVNLWRQVFAVAEQASDRSDGETIGPDKLTHAMTAAAVMGGIYFGNAIVAGLATDQDRRRAKEAFARNFITGIDIGKRQGFRVVSDMPVGGHA